MKKYISFFAMTLALSFGFVACDTETDEEPGGTKVEKMCGNWDVVYDAVDADGNVVYEDPYGKGEVTLFTYNTPDESMTQMYIDDQNKFWAFKFLVNINYAARTFSANDSVWYDAAHSGKVRLGESPFESAGYRRPRVHDSDLRVRMVFLLDYRCRHARELLEGDDRAPWAVRHDDSLGADGMAVLAGIRGLRCGFHSGVPLCKGALPGMG